MPHTLRRPFSLLDAMILVAATAIGLGGLRVAVGDLNELGAELRESIAAFAEAEAGWSSWGWAIYQGYGLLAGVLVPFCCAWTFAILAIRLRRPRPRLRHLARQPGAIACYAAVILFTPALVGLLGVAWIWGLLSGAGPESPEWQRLFGLAFLLMPAMAGVAVLGSWATLLLGRRWRAEPTWIDRAGRCLGVFWIGAIILPLWAIG